MTPATHQIILRDIRSIDELAAVEDLQIEVWGLDPREIVSRFTFIPAVEVGGILIGAFDGSDLVGFSFGLVGVEDGEVMIHSDMLAVKSDYRSHNLGFRLKLAQRDRALEKGVRLITWTYDPLQSRNARLNFAKLGVVSSSYRVNFYGESSSSPLHANVGTDRLWVQWWIGSGRVSERIEKRGFDESLIDNLKDVEKLVRVGDSGAPVSSVPASLSTANLLIEIPGDIGTMQHGDPALAFEWRLATRDAFTKAIDAGYRVEEFYRVSRQSVSAGVYQLRRRERGGPTKII